MRRLIIGCGYLGQRIANLWQEMGDEVAVLTRSDSHARAFAQRGFIPHVGDVLDPSSLVQLPVVETVLWAVGWDRSSGHSQRAVYVTGLQNTLQTLAGRCAQFIYISSTSVYGQSSGEWIDEASACQPTQPNGQVCLEGEELVRQFGAAGQPQATVLRLSGIYGPDRLLSRVASLKSGQPLSGNPDAWLNLVHVDDAANAVVHGLGANVPRPLYLISDDEPLTRRTYYSELARLVGAPVPSFEAAAGQSPTGRADGGLNKRCRNVLARQDLNWTLRYPTYREGLPHAIAGTGSDLS